MVMMVPLREATVVPRDPVPPNDRNDYLVPSRLVDTHASVYESHGNDCHDTGVTRAITITITITITVTVNMILGFQSYQ